MPKTRVSRSDFLFSVRFAIDYVKNKVLPGAIERFQKERNNKVGKSPFPPRFFYTISDYKNWEAVSMQIIQTRTRFSGSAENVLKLEYRLVFKISHNFSSELLNKRNNIKSTGNNKSLCKSILFIMC